jgi:hypothetical protein
MAEIIPRISVTASDYGPQYTAPGGDTYYLPYGDGNTRIPMTTTAWAAATVSTTGAPTVTNTVDLAWRQLIISSGAQAALIRQYAGLSGSVNWLPGPLNQIDWDKPWRLRITLRLDIGGNGTGFKWTLFMGGLNAAPTGHTMSAKGANLCIIGTATDAGTIQVGAHNGTAQVDSSTSAQTFDGTPKHLDIHYIPGTGLILLIAGTVVASVASASLPAGLGTASHNGWGFLMEHTTATAGASTCVVTNMTLSL